MSVDKKRSSSINVLNGILRQWIRVEQQGVAQKAWKRKAMFRHFIGSWFRRRRFYRKEGIKVPIAITLSPTMRCNLSCVGCYARDYPSDGELSMDKLDDLLASAERMGISVCIITGGEPLMRDGIIELFQNHKRIIFMMITNGTLLDPAKAKIVAESKNIVPLLSIEGSREQTDERRGSGVYDLVKRAMGCLRDEKVLYGFASMVTRKNFKTLGSSDFVEEMIDCGCGFGFFTEYVPVGTSARWDLVLEDDERDWFRNRLLELRRNNPVLLAHLPDDEYGSDDRCKAVVHGCVHINAQGYVEPCPFTHLACDNVLNKRLDGIFHSEFLSQIRSSEAIVRRGRLGCALFENRQMVERIAFRTGAQSTDKPSGNRRLRP